MNETDSRSRILITDDNEMNREILKEILSDSYDLVEAENGRQAIEIIEEMGSSLDLVLLDIVMPEMDGFDVLAVMNRRQWIKTLPVIMISAEVTPSYINRAYELGVTDYITRPFDVFVVQHRVNNTMVLFQKQKKLIELVSEQIYEKQRNNNMMVQILSHIVEFRNGESGLHVLHVNTLTEILLKTLMKKTDKYGLTNESIATITMASSLHDIGKISIPEEILNKPGKLTKEEFEIMKTHSAIGAEMLKNIPFDQSDPLIQYSFEICRWHHERWDGRGYPDGLVGEQIPISAQVVAMADVYDALTSERVYKPAFTHERAVQMIVNGECGAFNPLILECLEDSQDEIQRELKVVSTGNRSEKQANNAAVEILRSKNIIDGEGVSPSRERNILQYYGSTGELRFYLDSASDVLVLTTVDADGGNTQRIIATQQQHEQFKRELLGCAIQSLWKDCQNTTAQMPMVSSIVDFETEKGKRHFALSMCAIWTNDSTPHIKGAMGFAVDVTDYLDVAPG